MPYVPVALPPGVLRNGTLYQAKGRWYGANLVRWREGAMQPIGGWTRVERNDAPELSAAISDDGTVFTDYTTEANSGTLGDFVLTPAVPAENDAFYFALAYPFKGVGVQYSVAQVGGGITWEYYASTNDGEWKALSNVVDNSSGFTATEANTYAISWDLPTDWTTTTVNSQGPFYYVRARCNAAATSGATGSFADMVLSPIKLLEPVRGSVGWKDNGQNSWAGFGTATKLYAFGGSFVYDITPAGFTTGDEDASSTAGQYGDGAFSGGLYGTGDAGAATLTEAQTWQVDTFGEDLVAVAYSDGKLYKWDTSVGGATPAAVMHAYAPIENVGVVVTPERFVVALGGRGNVTAPVDISDPASDARRVIWSDQEDEEEWDPTVAGSQAGDFILPGAGELMCGARNRNETLLWTDIDLFSMRYIGGTLVYSFAQVGAQCGIISRHAKAVVDGRAYWMGQRGFFMYDGYAKPLPCPVSDDVFNNLNREQRSKIVAISVSEYGQIWFAYPSAGSLENDTIVSYNYLENHWSGPWTLERTAGFDRGPFDYPVLFDSLGQMYYHETGTEYYVPAWTSQLTPSAETGPIELGQGDTVMTVNRLVPDEDTLGEVDATLYASLFPTATEDSQAITTLSEPTSCRLTGRQVRLKVLQDTPGWRVGVFRLEVTPRGRR
jgi:hypothetical protein